MIVYNADTIIIITTKLTWSLSSSSGYADPSIQLSKKFVLAEVLKPIDTSIHGESADHEGIVIERLKFGENLTVNIISYMFKHRMAPDTIEMGTNLPKHKENGKPAHDPHRYSKNHIYKHLSYLVVKIH